MGGPPPLRERPTRRQMALKPRAGATAAQKRSCRRHRHRRRHLRAGADSDAAAADSPQRALRHTSVHLTHPSDSSDSRVV